ncbi:MAG: glycosyltransferase family 2 protein [Chitinophagaceae bacterium]|nr:glycosyltransferase family 2 protein [Chitinophagaceae bacterium]
MKISGFTIIKNAVINDYPVVESITSILPLVDEMIVLAGDSSDSTRALLESIKSNKMKIIDSIWDPALRTGGQVLAVETDKAFQLVAADSDWAFYIQADEVLHEKYHLAIKEACLEYKNEQQVEGLLFNYLHFYGTYDYVGDSRRWYNKEIRIIRNNKSIRSYKDAQGFRKNGKKLKVKQIDACIYHYGWVKSPLLMKNKLERVGALWHSDETMNMKKRELELFNFDDFDSLALFPNTHPEVMKPRIKNTNWSLNIDTSRKRFKWKDRILYYVEKATGKRLFSFKNYKLVK